MTVDAASARVQKLLRELEQLNRRLEIESRDEARAVEQLARAQRSLQSTSPSFKAMRESDVNRKIQELLSLQRKRATTQQTVAAKNSELSRAQAELAKAQVQESKRRLDEEQRRRREQDARDRALRDELKILRAAPPVAKPAATTPTTLQYDLFISHASEDKDEVVRPLAELLRDHGLRVWYDEFVLKVGDSLRRKIDEGLAHSRFGVVVLSPAFFAKNWTQYELDGLVATENSVGQKVILPIWHRLTLDEIVARSPSLADRVALNTSIMSLSQIAEALVNAVRDAA